MCHPQKSHHHSNHTQTTVQHEPQNDLIQIAGATLSIHPRAGSPPSRVLWIGQRTTADHRHPAEAGMHGHRQHRDSSTSSSSSRCRTRRRRHPEEAAATACWLVLAIALEAHQAHGTRCAGAVLATRQPLRAVTPLTHLLLADCELTKLSVRTTCRRVPGTSGRRPAFYRRQHARQPVQHAAGWAAAGEVVCADQQAPWVASTCRHSAACEPAHAC
jgi:hypothetical protein